MFVYVYIPMYIYIYRERERGAEIQKCGRTYVQMADGASTFRPVSLSLPTYGCEIGLVDPSGRRVSIEVLDESNIGGAGGAPYFGRW